MSPAVVHPAPDLLGRVVVVGVGGADEPVEGDVQLLLQPLEHIGVAAGQLGGRHTLGGRRFGHLEPMHVGSGEVADVESVQPLESGDRIGGDVFVGMPDVGVAVGIGDGCRYVEGLAHLTLSLLCGGERSCVPARLPEPPGAAASGAAVAACRRAHASRCLRCRGRRRGARDRGPRRGRRRAGRRHHRRRPGLGALGDRGRRLGPARVRGRGAAPDAGQRAHRRSQDRHRAAGGPSPRGGGRGDRHGQLLARPARRLRLAERAARGLRLAHRPGQADRQAADDPQPRCRRRRAGRAACRGRAGHGDLPLLLVGRRRWRGRVSTRGGC